MKSSVSRESSAEVASRPSTSIPRSISFRAPAPIMPRADWSGTGARPSRRSTKLSASIRSGAVSTSVPSRSKTISRETVISARQRSSQARAYLSGFSFLPNRSADGERRGDVVSPSAGMSPSESRDDRGARQFGDRQSLSGQHRAHEADAGKRGSRNVAEMLDQRESRRDLDEAVHSVGII